MDNLKKSILKLIQEDARYTPKEIADIVGSDEKTVADIVKDMEDKGVIVKYTAIVDSEQLNSEVVQALIEVRVTPQKNRGFDAIAEDIYGFDEVKSLYLMSGAYDLAVFVECPTLRAVSNFVSEKLSALDTVISTATHFILKKYKIEGTLACEKNDFKRLNIKL